MDLDYFVFDFAILIIIKDYGNVGMVLDELRVILLGAYVKKSLQICADWAVNKPKIGATSGLNWYYIVHWKTMIFGGLICQWFIFQWDLELFNFELCRQSYGHFTEDCTEYIKTGSSFEQWTLRRIGIDWPIENF